MKNILVINCGSSSLKYQLINMENEEPLAKGIFERIAIPGSKLTHEPVGREKFKIEKDVKNHTEAIALVLEALTDKEHGVIKDASEIYAIGHRVVQGGVGYKEICRPCATSQSCKPYGYRGCRKGNARSAECGCF